MIWQDLPSEIRWNVQPFIDGRAAELGCEFLLHDVSDEAQWNEVIRRVQTRHAGLHVLVNNAGITGPMDAVSPEETRLSDWRRIFAINVEGVFLGCKTAIPAIHISGGGSIVNMSSDDARHMTGAKLVVDGGFIHCNTYQVTRAKAG